MWSWASREGFILPSVSSNEVAPAQYSMPYPKIVRKEPPEDSGPSVADVVASAHRRNWEAYLAMTKSNNEAFLAQMEIIRKQQSRFLEREDDFSDRLVKAFKS